MIDSGHAELAALLRQRDQRIKELEARVAALEALCAEAAKEANSSWDGAIECETRDKCEAAGRSEAIE